MKVKKGYRTSLLGLFCLVLGSGGSIFASQSSLSMMSTTTLPKITNSNALVPLLKQHDVVVLALFKEGCPYCTIAAPKMEALAKKYHDASYAGRVYIVELEKGDAQDLRKRYGVMQFPTVLIFHKGHLVEKIANSQEPVSRYEGIIEQCLMKKA